MHPGRECTHGSHWGSSFLPVGAELDQVLLGGTVLMVGDGDGCWNAPPLQKLSDIYDIIYAFSIILCHVPMFHWHTKVGEAPAVASSKAMPVSDSRSQCSDINSLGSDAGSASCSHWLRDAESGLRGGQRWEWKLNPDAKGRCRPVDYEVGSKFFIEILQMLIIWLVELSSVPKRVLCHMALGVCRSRWDWGRTTTRGSREWCCKTFASRQRSGMIQPNWMELECLVFWLNLELQLQELNRVF